jgi:hypothetical protein
MGGRQAAHLTGMTRGYGWTRAQLNGPKLVLEVVCSRVVGETRVLEWLFRVGGAPVNDDAVEVRYVVGAVVQAGGGSARRGVGGP